MSEKSMIIDAHVHLYPKFDLAKAVVFGLMNMDEAKPDKEAAKFWLLTERSDCSAFAQLQESVQLGKYDIFPTSEPEALRLQLGERIVLYIVAGRQVVTSEGHEIGILASFLQLPDWELEAAMCIDTALEARALVSINWAPGKWLGKRKKSIAALLSQQPRSGLFIGDSAMRPTRWSEPDLMRAAKNHGWPLLAGSDPLPFSGEERSFGRYGCMVSGELDPDRPVSSLKSALLRTDSKITIWGNRRGTWEFLNRQFAIMRDKRARQMK